MKDDQILALTSQVQAMKKDQDNKKERGENKDRKVPQWKTNRSITQSNKYKKNDKTYKWCTGPGHKGIGMWVLHEPGSCTGKTPQAPKNETDKTALTSMIRAQGNLSTDEVESKLEAIMAVLHS